MRATKYTETKPVKYSATEDDPMKEKKKHTLKSQRN